MRAVLFPKPKIGRVSDKSEATANRFFAIINPSKEAKIMRIKNYFSLLLVSLIFVGSVLAQAQRTITIVTEPNASIWLNDILRGKTDESGKLIIQTDCGGSAQDSRSRRRL
jgi:hypothetical protein